MLNQKYILNRMRSDAVINQSTVYSLELIPSGSTNGIMAGSDNQAGGVRLGGLSAAEVSGYATGDVITITIAHE
jgi:hypothetical protein